MPSKMQKEMIKWQIRQSMGEELVASSVYHTRALTAREAGDEKTAKLYEHIAEEEDGHWVEFGKRLDTGFNGDIPNY